MTQAKCVKLFQHESPPQPPSPQPPPPRPPPRPPVAASLLRGRPPLPLRHATQPGRPRGLQAARRTNRGRRGDGAGGIGGCGLAGRGYGAAGDGGDPGRRRVSGVDGQGMPLQKEEEGKKGDKGG